MADSASLNLDNVVSLAQTANTQLSDIQSKLQTDKTLASDPSKLLALQLEMSKAMSALTTATSMISSVGNATKEVARNTNIH